MGVTASPQAGWSQGTTHLASIIQVEPFDGPAVVMATK